MPPSVVTIPPAAPSASIVSSSNSHLNKSSSKDSQTRSQSSIYECFMCSEFTTKNLDEIPTHVKKKHFSEKPGLGCIYEGCNFRRPTLEEVRQHMKKEHKEDAQPLICFLCEVTRKTEDQLERHLRIIHLKDNEYVCNVCQPPKNKPFATFSLNDWCEHIHTQHPGNPPDITINKEEGYEEDDEDIPLSKSMKGNQTPSKPSNEDNKGKSKDEQRKSSGYSYVCSTCKYKSKDLTSMSVHVKQHGKGGKFEIKYDYELALDKTDNNEKNNKPAIKDNEKSTPKRASDDNNVAKRIAQEILDIDLKESNKNDGQKNAKATSKPKVSQKYYDPFDEDIIEEDSNENQSDNTEALFKCLACPEKFMSQEILVDHFEKSHDVANAPDGLPPFPKPPTPPLPKGLPPFPKPPTTPLPKPSTPTLPKPPTPKPAEKQYEVVCQICLHKTSKAIDMKEHITTAHFSDLTCTCPHCPNEFATPRDLLKHGQIQHYKHFSLSKTVEITQKNTSSPQNKEYDIDFRRSRKDTEENATENKEISSREKHVEPTISKNDKMLSSKPNNKNDNEEGNKYAEDSWANMGMRRFKRKENPPSNKAPDPIDVGDRDPLGNIGEPSLQAPSKNLKPINLAGRKFQNLESDKSRPTNENLDRMKIAKNAPQKNLPADPLDLQAPPASPKIDTNKQSSPFAGAKIVDPLDIKNMKPQNNGKEIEQNKVLVKREVFNNVKSQNNSKDVEQNKMLVKREVLNSMKPQNIVKETEQNKMLVKKDSQNKMIKREPGQGLRNDRHLTFSKPNPIDAKATTVQPQKIVKMSSNKDPLSGTIGGQDKLGVSKGKSEMESKVSSPMRQKSLQDKSSNLNQVTKKINLHQVTEKIKSLKPTQPASGKIESKGASSMVTANEVPSAKKVKMEKM